MRYHGACGSPVWSLHLDERRAQSEALYTQILGEPLYVVFTSELRLEHRPTLHGFASAGVHSLVQECLPQRYRGPSPGVVISDGDLRRQDPATAATLFDAAALHEVSHIAASGITRAVCQRFHGGAHREQMMAAAPSEPLLWLHHGAAFLRALCHLAHRVQSRGHLVSLELAFSHEAYGLSPAVQYRMACGDECSATSWLSLREALGRPSPAEFQELWTSDVRESLKSCPELREGFV